MNLVKHAEDWQYESLFRWNQSSEPLPKTFSPWPIPRLPNWIQRVNEALDERELDAIRTCVNRGRPLGDEQWTDEVAEWNALWFTITQSHRLDTRSGAMVLRLQLH